MAIDSGNSRNWAGIHFVDANRDGVEVGRKVGRNALDKASRYWSKRGTGLRRRPVHPAASRAGVHWSQQMASTRLRG